MALSAALAGVGAAPAYASSHGAAHGSNPHRAASHGPAKDHLQVSHAAALAGGQSHGNPHSSGASPAAAPDATLVATVVPASNAAPPEQAQAPNEVARASEGPVHTVSLPVAVPSPAPAAASLPGAIDNEPMILSSGGWQGISLQAAVDLRIPMLFGAAVLLFVLLQALVDRRDPKVSRAPERGDDDTVGFA